MSQPPIILLYGPALAGKSTILEYFAQHVSLKRESFELKPPGQSFAERGYRVANERVVVAMTIPGAVWTIGTWEELLKEESRIIVVADPQESRREVNHEYLDYLGNRCQRIAAIQVTKTDIVGRDVAEQVTREICRRYSLKVPVSYSTTNDPASVYALMDHLTSGVR